jgi:hypothetical protein
MNNTFYFPRFILLLRKTLMERPAQTFGVVLLNFIVIVLLYAFLRDIIGWDGTQNLTFFWGFIFGGCYLSAAMFNHFSSNANGSAFLTLPCSTLEKWLCAFLISCVLYVIVYLLFFKAVDFAFVQYYHSHLNPAELHYTEKLEAVQLLPYTQKTAVTSYMIYANLVTSMLVGSLYFNRLAFIKTGLAICAVFVGMFALNYLVAQMLFGQVDDAFPFSHVSMRMLSPGISQETALMMRPRNEVGDITLPSPYGEFSRSVIRFAVPAILCITSFVRLKEKEF